MTLAVAKFGSDLAPARRAAILWSCVLSMATVVVLAHAVFRDVRDPARTDPRSVSPYARRVCDAAANGFLARSAGITVALAVFAYRNTLALFAP